MTHLHDAPERDAFVVVWCTSGATAGMAHPSCRTGTALACTGRERRSRMSTGTALACPGAGGWAGRCAGLVYCGQLRVHAPLFGPAIKQHSGKLVFSPVAGVMALAQGGKAGGDCYSWAEPLSLSVSYYLCQCPTSFAFFSRLVFVDFINSKKNANQISQAVKNE